MDEIANKGGMVPCVPAIQGIAMSVSYVPEHVGGWFLDKIPFLQ